VQSRAPGSIPLTVRFVRTSMPVLAKNVKTALTKGFAKAYGSGRPQPWQEEAIVEAALKWDEKLVRLFDHPRGSGKTKEIAMMTHVALKCLGVRLVLLISDRKDLDMQLYGVAKHFLEKNGHGVDIVTQISKSQQLERVIRHLEEDPQAKAVVTVTLQSFPHVSLQLSENLRKASAALADEAHRSHADKSLSEELNRVLGGPVHFLLYTGTASDRCLRLFGERERRGSEDSGQEAIDLCKPFHSVSETVVATKGMIFELGALQRRCMDLNVDFSAVEAMASKLNLKRPFVQALKERAATTRAERALMMKTAYFMQEFMAVRIDLRDLFVPQMMIVTSSRRAVMDYVEACRAHAHALGETLKIYGAFSSRLTLAAAGDDADGGPEVDEQEYNKALIDQCPDEHGSAHRHADILVVCDRFETGYDNDAICVVAVDKKVTSPEKLVQIYSRGNRKRPGKKPPLVIDVQNASKDVEHAVCEYTMPRECLSSDAGDVVRQLSQQLCESMGSLLDKTREDLEAAFSEWTPEARSKLGGLLAPYLRRRKEGVSRAVAVDILPVKQAELAWKVLTEKHRCDVAPIAHEMRVIADLAVSKSCSLSTASFTDSGANSIAQVTPQKRLSSDGSLAADDIAEGVDGDFETPAKRLRPTMEALEELRAGLMDAEVADDACVAVGSVADIARDVRAIARSKGHGQRRTFQCLQRIAEVARDSSQHKALLDAGAAEALIHTFINGDRIEQQWAWKGLQGLASTSARVSTVCGCHQHLQILQEATALRQQELEACKALLATMTGWQSAVQSSAELDRKISSNKEELTCLKSKKLTLTDFLPKDCDSDSDDAWDVRRRKTKKEEKEEARERKQIGKAKLQVARTQQEDRIQELQAGLKNYEMEKTQAINDFPVARLLGLPQALQRMPAICKGKFRAQGRKFMIEAWQCVSMLDADCEWMGTVAKCLKGVESARRARSRATSESKLKEVLASLPSIAAHLEVVIQLGIVDELLAISATGQVSVTGIECLRVFANVSTKGHERVALYDELVAKMRTEDHAESSEDGSDSDNIAADTDDKDGVTMRALSQLRQKLALAKQPRKRGSQDFA